MKTVASKAFEIVTGRKVNQSIDPFHVIQRVNKTAEIAIEIHNHLKHTKKKRGRPTKQSQKDKGKKDIPQKRIFLIRSEKLRGKCKSLINDLLAKSNMVTES